jgi:hypothetical protein
MVNKNIQGIRIQGDLDVTSVTGSFSGSFVGNGSGLTNLPASNPFPFTGSAIISGSLIVTGSITSDTDATINGVEIGTGGSSSDLRNISIGSGLSDLLEGQRNIGIGLSAGGSLQGSKNIAIGDLPLNTEGPITGDQNIAIGTSALAGIGSGSYNVGLGGFEGYSDQSNNIFISDGEGNLRLLITGSNGDAFFSSAVSASVFKGDGSGLSNTTSTVEQSLTFAASDESTPLVAGTSKITFRTPHAMELYQIPRASLTSGSTSGNVVVDINENGNSILGANKLSIDANEKTSVTATTPTTLADTSLADDAEITIDIDSAGTNAAGLKITLYYRKA